MTCYLCSVADYNDVSGILKERYGRERKCSNIQKSNIEQKLVLCGDKKAQVLGTICNHVLDVTR